MSETYQEARKNVLMQFQSDILGVDVSVPMTTETKELIAKVSDSLHDVVSTLGK